MSKYQQLPVKSIHQETLNSVVVEFEIPANSAEQWDFQAGQYVGVRAEIDGEDVRRSYSICSTPADGSLRIGIKKVPGGKFSTYANETLKAGDTIEVMPPQGRFTHQLDPNSEKQYVFFAAGSGITPIIALMGDILQHEPNSEVTLFYGNRTSDSIMFKEELAGLKNLYFDRLSLHHILSKERQGTPYSNGRIDREKCEIFGKIFFDTSKVDKCFLCGPEEMILEVSDWLKSEGIAEDNIKFELFTTPGSKAFVRSEEVVKKSFDPERESHIIVRIDGDTTEFTLEYGGTSILDAATKAGADAPFSCKGGVCSTCKAMVMEGEVEMDVNYGLEPDEVEDGYVLTCQSHPRTEHILVDYDV